MTLPSGSLSRKYVAVSTDAEAHYIFAATDFDQYQGNYSTHLVNVAEMHHIPLTWLIVADSAAHEAKGIARDILPRRRDSDEFSLHSHFKYYIEDATDPDAWRDPKRRLDWLRMTMRARRSVGLPAPRTFRYGGGDSAERYYRVEELNFLCDAGVRNFLFTPDRLDGIIGLGRCTHLGNNVWRIGGGRRITLLRTLIYLDRGDPAVIPALSDHLDRHDYAILGSHDYRACIPDALDWIVELFRFDYDIRFTTIDRIGELVRAGKIRNE